MRMDREAGFEYQDKEWSQIARGTAPGKHFVDLLGKVRPKLTGEMGVAPHRNPQQQRRKSAVWLFVYCTWERVGLHTKVGLQFGRTSTRPGGAVLSLIVCTTTASV